MKNVKAKKKSNVSLCVILHKLTAQRPMCTQKMDWGFCLAAIIARAWQQIVEILTF